MNAKVYKQIHSFSKQVSYYIDMEYDSYYSEYYKKHMNDTRFVDFVGSYYLGGNNVPDTARYVVELITMIHNDQA